MYNNMRCLDVVVLATRILRLQEYEHPIPCKIPRWPASKHNSPRSASLTKNTRALCISHIQHSGKNM